MFVDASVLCAILLPEPDGARFAAVIGASDACVTSHIAAFEALRALIRENRMPYETASVLLDQLLTEADIRVIEIGHAEGEFALEALERFGKGRHPAKLNMGDCFAYGCARAGDMPMLFKGGDFVLTDIESAL